jgi:hypothetical protein
VSKNIKLEVELVKTYRYKGKDYLTDRYVLMKCPSTRSWVSAILYFSVPDEGMCFIREESDFLKKFLLITWSTQ